MDKEALEVFREEMSSAGLGEAKAISAVYSTSSFGNAAVTYELGSLRLQLVRDRGHLSASVGPADDPSVRFLFKDIAVMMGWPAVELKTFSGTLAAIARHCDDIEEVFSVNGRARNIERIRQVAMVRVEARWASSPQGKPN